MTNETDYKIDIVLNYIANHVGRIELTNNKKVELHMIEVRNLMRVAYNAGLGKAHAIKSELGIAY